MHYGSASDKPEALFFPTSPWTPGKNKLLGTMPDRKLAARLGRSLDSVKSRRKSRRIPSFAIRGP